MLKLEYDQSDKIIHINKFYFKKRYVIKSKLFIVSLLSFTVWLIIFLIELSFFKIKAL